MEQTHGTNTWNIGMEQTHDMLLEEAKWSVIDKIAGREGR